MITRSSAFRYTCWIYYLLLATACGVKNYPKESPFVYQNKIEIENNRLTREEKTVLKSKLTTQLTDNLQLRVKEQFVFFRKLIEPPVFDTSELSQSAANMNIYLKTIGYYNGKTSTRYELDTIRSKRGKPHQMRVTTHFQVETGPLFLIDTVAYELSLPDSTLPVKSLQELAEKNKSESVLKKGLPFNEDCMLEEMDRLVDLFRNNGYLQFSRELLYAEIDTVFHPLLNPLLNPFERLQLMKEAEKRRKQPLVEITLRILPTVNKESLTRYRIGSVHVYPDFATVTNDSIKFFESWTEHLHILQRTNLYKGSFLETHIHLMPGKLYKLSDLNRTLDDLNNLGIWQFIKIDPEKAIDTVSTGDTATVNFKITMIPSKKYSFSADLESVFNQTQQTASATAGNLIGLGINLGIRDKNFAHQGILHSNTIRGGIESGIGGINSGLQATELSFSNNLTMPKLLLLGKKWDDRFLFKRTIINTNITSINRNINNKGLFSLTNIGSSFGWQIRNKKNQIFSFKPLNVEYVNLYNISSGFKQQLDTTPFLRYSFSQGLVVGSVFSFTRPRILSAKRPNHTRYFRIGLEESGALFGRLKKLVPIFDRDLFEYIKAEVEYKHEIRQRKSSWAFRTIAGAGYLYDDSTSMPFFKQFTGGGPNSMRAWPLRSIGPGASPLEKRSGRNQFFSRSGDILFEANAEFRYDILTILPNTFVIRGALFTDIGNIWNFEKASNRQNDTVVFRLRNFYRDLSVSTGTGFRFDFIGLFMLRLDIGLRVKNPALPFSETNNGWRWPDVTLARMFSSKEEYRQWRYENFNFSLGINYPF